MQEGWQLRVRVWSSWQRCAGASGWLSVRCVALLRTVILLSVGDRGGTVVKIFYYKSEGRWFDSRWCHLHNPSDRSMVMGVDLASNWNEYQEHFLGIKAAGSGAACLLRSWVRIPLGAWMSVCCECCVLSGRDLCDEPITRPEDSYRLWCVVVCDLETSCVVVM